MVIFNVLFLSACFWEDRGMSDECAVSDSLSRLISEVYMGEMENPSSNESMFVDRFERSPLKDHWVDFVGFNVDWVKVNSSLELWNYANREGGVAPSSNQAAFVMGFTKPDGTSFVCVYSFLGQRLLDSEVIPTDLDNMKVVFQRGSVLGRAESGPERKTAEP